MTKCDVSGSRGRIKKFHFASDVIFEWSINHLKIIPEQILWLNRFQGISELWNFECLTKNNKYNRLIARIKYVKVSKKVKIRQYLIQIEQ